MDYLFMIELNGQTADLDAVKQTITGFAPSSSSSSLSVLYLGIDELRKGIVGIARFAEESEGSIAKDFFDKVRHQVALINHLPLNKLPPANKLTFSNLDPSDIPQDPATWARVSLGNALIGFDRMQSPPPEINADDNKYEILGTMLGGIGGKR